MNYFYSTAGNMNIDDSIGIFFTGAIGVRRTGFDEIFHNVISNKWITHKKKTPLVGLWAFVEADSTTFDNPSYNPDAYNRLPESSKPLHKFLYLTKTFKNDYFYAINVVENSALTNEINLAKTIGSGSGLSLYQNPKPYERVKVEKDISCKNHIEIYNGASECIFTNALFPLNIIDVIDIKNPFGADVASNSQSPLKYTFLKDIMIIPLKLPYKLITTPRDSNSFNCEFTYTEFTLSGEMLSFNLNKYSKYVNIDVESSKKIAKLDGETFFDVTKQMSSSIYQSDLLVMVAELPEAYKRQNRLYFERDDEDCWVGYNY